MIFHVTKAGTFSKSETPVEARHFGDKANQTVLGAGFGGVKSETTTTTAQSTTTTYTESPTIQQILDEVTPPSIPLHDDGIVYGENLLHIFHFIAVQGCIQSAKKINSFIK